MRTCLTHPHVQDAIANYPMFRCWEAMQGSAQAERPASLAALLHPVCCDMDKGL